MTTAATDASPWVPPSRKVADLETAAHDCRGCELWEPATQVVFSTGSPSASVIDSGSAWNARYSRCGASTTSSGGTPSL